MFLAASLVIPTRKRSYTQQVRVAKPLAHVYIHAYMYLHLCIYIYIHIPLYIYMYMYVIYLRCIP